MHIYIFRDNYISYLCDTRIFRYKITPELFDSNYFIISDLLTV